MKLKNKIISILQKYDCLSDSEITYLMFNDKTKHQQVNSTCRLMEKEGILKRQKDPFQTIKNYLIKNNQEVLIERPRNNEKRIIKKEIYNHEEELKEKFNSLIQRLAGRKKDYYRNLKVQDFLNLKLALKNINNIITHKLTLIFLSWLSEKFNFNHEDENKIRKEISNISPNAPGYDIKIEYPEKILVEVKANDPVNKSSYGSQQDNMIKKDINSLLSGKRELKNKGTLDYYKFMAILNFKEKTKKAIKNIINKCPPEIKSKIEIYTNNNKLNKEKLFIVLIDF